jgi:2'-5' RNA ligase
MPPERWRLFVAVPIPDDLRRDLAAAVERWRVEADVPELRWTDSASWHVTLAFLGATPADEVPRIVEALRGAVARHAAFSLPTGGLGAFPRPQYARVVWYGVGDDGRLAELARSIREALRVEDGAFRAHITLARLPRATSVEEWLRNHQAPPGELAVQEIRLMRTQQVGQRDPYEPLAAAEIPRSLTVQSTKPLAGNW